MEDVEEDRELTNNKRSSPDFEDMSPASKRPAGRS
jgi:hypothetical protein